MNEKQWIILILVVVVSILACLQYMPPLNNYRLGDFVRRVSEFEYLILRKAYVMQLEPWSIVAQYDKLTNKANDLESLAQIVSDYDGVYGDVECAIHVRLGDVIDNHTRSVEDFLLAEDEDHKGWDAMNGVTWKGGHCESDVCNSEGYVKPLAYFDRLMKRLPADVREVTLISGSYKKTKNPDKSQEYLRRLSGHLMDKGYHVKIRWNKSADDDFVIICRAQYIIATRGGFSQLAAMVGDYMGATVLS